MTASNVLSKHKDLRKEMIGLMNKHHGTLSLIEIKKRIPALNDMTAMLVSQVYGKHNKAAKRLGGHFKEALANTKSGGMVFNVDEDDEELEDDDRKPEAMPDMNSRKQVSMVSPMTTSAKGAGHVLGGNWTPVHRVFEWNKSVDDGLAKQMYGIDIVPFSGSGKHMCKVEGNYTLVITTKHPDAFGKPKAIHKEMSKGAFSKMMTDPNAKDEYDNIQFRSVAATQQRTKDRNEKKDNFGMAVFTIRFCQPIDKKEVILKIVPHKDDNGKEMKLLVVDVAQVVADEFVETFEVASGLPTQPAAAARRTGELDEEN